MLRTKSIRLNKKPKIENISLAPITLAALRIRKHVKDVKILRVLADSGTSKSIVLGEHVKKWKKTKAKHPTIWNTKGGEFKTSGTCKPSFVLSELDQKKEIEWEFHVDNTKASNCLYDIIGMDLLCALEIGIQCSTSSITWNTNSIPFKDRREFHTMHANPTKSKEELYESNVLRDSTERRNRILDAKYEKADLPKIVKEQSDHLDNSQQQSLLTLLRKYEFLFDGTLGTWNTKPVDLKIQKDAKPVYSKPFPIPRSQEETLKREVKRLVKLGVLRKINRSEWSSPSFIIPKKNNQVRVVSDFRKLNKLLIRRPYPIPKIQDLLLKLEGFTYASSLDLNMGYYHIQLTPNARKLCTIVFPFGKYEYCRLPMGICNAPDIFQEKISELMEGLDFIRAYLDDLLILTKETWDDHLHKLETVLQRVATAGLKVNAEKSYFGRHETEYLGFWITREGVKPMPNKVEAMLNIKTPTKRKELRSFIGVVNYYRDMWQQRSHLLTPLTRLTSSKISWKWTSEEQKAFDGMKKVLSKETLLSYPDFNKPFDIHTDASKRQLGAVISQNGKPIAFYSRKLNDAQTRYTTTERELLSIVETLKEFRNILFGQQLRVYTDHKNLTYTNPEHNTERVMRWRLLLEEYGPELIYIKGEDNVVADGLSRLDFEGYSHFEPSHFDYEEFFSLDEVDKDVNPLSFNILHKYQLKDKKLQENKILKNYSTKIFLGVDSSYNLVLYKDKIVVPDKLKKRVLNWYHDFLLHPGVTRTEETIRQHLYWKGMRADVEHNVKTCKTCQKYKKQKKKYGLLPAKEAEAKPWEILCVDLIGEYTIRRKNDKPLHLKPLTMIDPATGWFEMHQYNDKQAISIANLVEHQWLSRYPWPQKLLFDNGSEFVGKDFKQMIDEDYGIKAKPTTVRNPQANAILESIHQVIGNMVRSFQLEDAYMDDDDPWAGILSAVAFAVRSTYHTTLKATPGQLVFNRDMIFNIQHVADWKLIKDRKQKLINKNNKNENKTRIPHQYNIGDKVLLERHRATKMECPTTGPHEIRAVYPDNGTIAIKVGPVTQRVNIRRVVPIYD